MKKLLYRILTKLGCVAEATMYYIGGSDVLPSPLKGNEELEALEALESGSDSAKQQERLLWRCC